MKTFKYRLYPTRAQTSALETILETHRRLYNDALESRKVSWEDRHESVGYAEQCGQLKALRLSSPYVAQTNASSCQATLRRLDRSFQSFFRRIKAGEKPGYPRFKGRNQFDSVTFKQYGNGWKLNERHVYFQHIGQVKVKLHRPVLGKIKTATFKCEAGRWFVTFCCETADMIPVPSTNPPVGIDLGLKSFLVTSDGTVIDPPKLYRKSEKKLRVGQRRLSRRKKGSKRRAKARNLVARTHWHVANQRRDFHFKTAHSLVQDHGLVAHEDLNIMGIARTRLAKSTLDAGWGQFLEILRYKAECAGVGVIAVNPRNTTQTCSQCGNVPEQRLTLAERQYECQSCGLSMDRDLNAAKNILGLGLSLQASTCGTVQCVA